MIHFSLYIYSTYLYNIAIWPNVHIIILTIIVISLILSLLLQSLHPHECTT